MSKGVIYLARGLLIGLISSVILVGCAKQSQPSGTIITQTQPNQAEQFEKGPHQGALGERQFYFDCSSTLLPDQYRSAIDQQAQYLKKHRDQTIALQGYDASGGDIPTHLIKSYQRLVTVSNLLKLKGVKSAQIVLKPRGSWQSAPYEGSKDDDQCRVDLVYQDKKRKG